MIEKKKEFKFENHFILGQDDLEMAGFKHGFEPIGVSRSNSDEDKGRKGRELIENTCFEIKKKQYFCMSMKYRWKEELNG